MNAVSVVASAVADKKLVFLPFFFLIFFVDKVITCGYDHVIYCHKKCFITKSLRYLLLSHLLVHLTDTSLAQYELYNVNLKNSKKHFFFEFFGTKNGCDSEQDYNFNFQKLY